MKKSLAIIIVTISMLLVACDGIKPQRQNGPFISNAGMTEQVITPAAHSPRYNDGVGAFRTNCGISHFNYSDPIVYPGKPFATHLHAFFGNTGTNYSSTSASIANSGGSTCMGGTANRTAYWAPALIDIGSNTWQNCADIGSNRAGCKLIVPGGDPATARNCALASNKWTQYCLDQSNATQVYYKAGYRGVSSQDVVAPPPGLRMIAGNARANSPQSQSVTWWACKNFQGDASPKYSSITATNCQPGQLLVMAVEFPQCWDGRNLDSPDHKSHMAYALGWPDKGCPASHPVALPEITSWIYYRLPQNINLSTLRLSSDMYDGLGGYAAHSDWMNGWDQEVFQKIIDNCFKPGLDCQMNLLGDGTELSSK